MLSDGSRGNAEGAEPFDTLTVNGFPPLMVSLSNHANSILQLKICAACANFLPRQSNLPNRKYYLTTKHTKDTKVSDNDISKLLNFVLFVPL